MDTPEKPVACEIPGQEVAELLRRALRREVKAYCVGKSWTDLYAANVAVRIDGWELVIFNDCNQVDYVDSAVAPDGRRGDFDQWWLRQDEPIDLLTADEQNRLEYLLENAPVIS